MREQCAGRSRKHGTQGVTFHCVQFSNTALHEAAYSDHPDVVSLLLRHGATVNLQNSVRDIWCSDGEKVASGGN